MKRRSLVIASAKNRFGLFHEVFNQASESASRQWAHRIHPEPWDHKDFHWVDARLPMMTSSTKFSAYLKTNTAGLHLWEVVVRIRHERISRSTWILQTSRARQRPLMASSKRFLRALVVLRAARANLPSCIAKVKPRSLTHH